MAKNAAKIVTEAILGLDFRMVTVNGRVYRIDPPTIYRLAGAANCLATIADAQTLADIILKQEEITNVARALSWFICDSESLSEELSHGTISELTEGLLSAYNLLSVQDFSKLSALAKNVARMAANQKQ